MARILYVDDDPHIRLVATLSLQMEPSFEVRECASGAEALGAAAEWQPDLILLDVMMPGMDGPEALRKLREADSTASIPVIFITARVQPREVQQLIDLGARGVIPKPFDPLELAGQVKSHLSA
jgi:CheY-like chemotaxis protein